MKSWGSIQTRQCEHKRVKLQRRKSTQGRVRQEQTQCQGWKEKVSPLWSSCFVFGPFTLRVRK